MPPAMPGSTSGSAPTSAGRAWTSPTSGRRSAPTAASPSAAITSMPRRCAVCATAAAAKKWRRKCWCRVGPTAPAAVRLEFRLMTYCVGLLVDTGLVMLSDSRTNAGVDQINTFRKMTTFQRASDRILVLLSAGNLAITQAVVHALHEHPGQPEKPSGIFGALDMFDAARVVGDALREVHGRDAEHLQVRPFAPTSPSAAPATHHVRKFCRYCANVTAHAVSRQPLDLGLAVTQAFSAILLQKRRAPLRPPKRGPGGSRES